MDLISQMTTQCCFTAFSSIKHWT